MAGDQSLLKRINRMAIVRTVKDQPATSRSDLSAALGLAESTVSVLVNELIEEGWLCTEEAPQRRRAAGRRPQLLTLDTGRLGLIGAELGVDYLAVAACSLAGDLLFFRLADYEHAAASRSVAAAAALIGEARSWLAKAGRRPLGVGVGLPGMVSGEGLLRFAPNIGWRDVDMGALLREELRRAGPGDLEVSVLNDANAGALGEHVFGGAAAADSLVYLSAGHGMGAGIILGDRLQIGHAGLSGEVGHAILRPDGDPCPCGRRGCAETLLSQKVVSRMVTGQAEPVLHIEELLHRQARGESAVGAAASAAGEHLGLVIHNLVVTIDPAVLVVGGPLARLGGFFEAARASLERYAGASSYHRVELRASRFGASAGAIGAAAHVLQQLLRPPELRRFEPLRR